MSRSGYTDDCDNLNLYRGVVESAIRGRRGQSFLLKLLSDLDALPEKKLVPEAIQTEDGCVCALGSFAVSRGLDVKKIEAAFDDENFGLLVKEFGIAEPMIREIVYVNDEAEWRPETPEERYERVRKWVVSNIRPVECKDQ